MSKWKCEICNSEFDNFQAQGFNNKIYCPLCYFKELYGQTELERERLNNIIDLVVKDMEMTKYNPELPTYNSCIAVDKDHIQQWIDKLKEGKQ